MNCYYTLQPPPLSPRENALYILCALYLMFKMLDTIFLQRTFNFVKIILKNPQCNKIHKSIFTEVISLIKVYMYLKHFGRNFAFVKCISLRFDHFKKQIGGLKFLNIFCMHTHRPQLYGKFGLAYRHPEFPVQLQFRRYTCRLFRCNE